MLPVLYEAEALAAALGDSPRLAQISCSLSHHFRTTAAYDQALAAAQRACALATASRNAILSAVATRHIGQAYKAQGDYRRAIDSHMQVVACFEGPQRHELSGRTILQAVDSRANLASCHAELGTFAEGRALGDEGLRIAVAVDHPASLMLACWGVGLLSLRQGDLSNALPRLEQAVGLCQEADLPFWFPPNAAVLGEAYTLCGRVADAVALLTQALKRATAIGREDLQAFCHLHLGEAQLRADHLEEAQAFAERVLTLGRAHQEQGNEAYTLHLLGGIAAHRHLSEVAQAEDYYRQGLDLARELGMRPLLAHCHRGLGTLYEKSDRRAQARAALAVVIGLYRGMGMPFWLPEVEGLLQGMTTRGF
jgi:tetratricopeptide (TPR) repeat protein